MPYRRYDDDPGAGCIGVLFLASIVIGFALLAIYYFLQFAILIGAVSAAGASLVGIGFGIRNFGQTVKQAYKAADLDRYQDSEKKYRTDHIKLFKNLYEVQPAKLIYIYDAGWYVMKYVSMNVWQPTHEGALKIFEFAKEKILTNASLSGNYIEKAFGCLQYAAGVGIYLGGAFCYIAAFAIVGIFLALQLVFTIIGAIVTSVLMSILGIGTYLFGKFYGVYFRCPECHEQMKIPTYKCRKCNQDHSRLQPSIYGVFHHTCRHNFSGDVCNNSLPTLQILGRDKLLAKKCPSCNHPLQGAGGTNAHIPVVGAIDAGKSNYSIMATRELIEEYAPANNLEISFPNTEHRESYETNIEKLKSGNRLSKTLSVEGGAKGSNLEITKSNQAVNNLLYLYDTAGEDLINDDRSAKQETYFKYVHGIALLIDPFKIRQVNETYKKELDNVNINPEDQDLTNIFRIVLDLFEKVAPKGGKNKFPQPFAVVINKTDLCDLEQKIGSYAAREYMAKNSAITNEADAINILVEEFLNENGERNFVANVRSNFSNVRFFSCSALGSPDLTLTSSNLNSQSNSLKGIRVLEPMLWLMEQTKTLPNKASLGAKIFRSKIFVNYGLTAITSTVMIAVLGGLGYGGFSLIRWSSKQLQLSSIFKKSYITQSSSTSSKNNLFTTTTTESGTAKIGNQSTSTPNSSVESLPSQLNPKTIDTNATVVGQSGMKNIRSAAGTNYSVVGEIPTGNRVQIISTGYDTGGYLWYQVYSPSSNIKGWMAEQLIKAD